MKTKRGICRILAIATMVTACLLITTQADAKKQGRRTKYKSERLHKSLNLNESQEKAIYHLNRKYAEKSKEQAKKQKEKRQKDMLAMHKSKQKELKKILTKDQYKEYEKNINKQKKDFKGNRHKRKGYKK